MLYYKKCKESFSCLQNIEIYLAIIDSVSLFVLKVYTCIGFLSLYMKTYFS